MVEDLVLDTYLRVLSAAEAEGVKLHILIDTDDDERYGTILGAKGKAAHVAKALHMLEAARARVIRQRRLETSDSPGTQLYANQERQASVKRIKKAVNHIEKAVQEFKGDAQEEQKGCPIAEELTDAARQLANALQTIDGVLESLGSGMPAGEKAEIFNRLLDNSNRDKGVKRVRSARTELEGARKQLEEDAVILETASSAIAHRLVAPWPERTLADATERIHGELGSLLEENDRFQGEREVRILSEFDSLVTEAAVELRKGYSSRQIAEWLLGSKDDDSKDKIEKRLSRHKKKLSKGGPPRGAPPEVS